MRLGGWDWGRCTLKPSVPASCLSLRRLMRREAVHLAGLGLQSKMEAELELARKSLDSYCRDFPNYVPRATTVRADLLN